MDVVIGHIPKEKYQMKYRPDTNIRATFFTILKRG